MNQFAFLSAMYESVPPASFQAFIFFCIDDWSDLEFLNIGLFFEGGCCWEAWGFNSGSHACEASASLILMFLS
jgi:hypothetical protein